MTDPTSKPVIFLAFANDRNDRDRYLRNLSQEARLLREALAPAEDAGLCQVKDLQNVTLQDILIILRDPDFRNRIAVFHYGGHASGYELLFESTEGAPAPADAAEFANLLRQQNGLQLVFLNGCSSQGQAQALLDAGVSAVIATSQAIDDQVATDFAANFYSSLAGGVSLSTAFKEAESVVKIAKGGQVRQAYTRKKGAQPVADRWPWAIYTRPGAEMATNWNLPAAAGDPLFGLPPLPMLYLPASPYRSLDWFHREDAEVFFGRGREIRELFERVTSPHIAPITLFYGQTGAGKSSLLAAGLLPRLERDFQVCYQRRDQSMGLLGNLQEALGGTAEKGSLSDTWCGAEQRLGRPVIAILDQVEEVYTRPNPDRPRELEDLLSGLSEVFGDPVRCPQGGVVLSFRKEWLAEIKTQMAQYRLPETEVFLERLDRAGIIEVVTGPTRSNRLREKYGLRVDANLPEKIADDLLADAGSAVAPTLQILLSKMWEQARARDNAHPAFTDALYRELDAQGLGMDDFLTQQIQQLRERGPEMAAAVDSGLLLDLLAFHTTPLRTSEQHTLEEIKNAYKHQQALLPALLQHSQDLYLLVDPARSQPGQPPASRLSHDTLAPLVRRRFEESDAPGQRARRVVEGRAEDWKDKEGAPLDDADLALVEAGRAGMRDLKDYEECMIAASQKISQEKENIRKDNEKKLEDTRRQRTLFLWSGLVAALVLMAVAWTFYARSASNLSSANTRGTEAARNLMDANLSGTLAAANAATARAAGAEAIANAATATLALGQSYTSGTQAAANAATARAAGAEAIANAATATRALGQSYAAGTQAANSAATAQAARVEAVSEKQRAEEQARIALARQLAAQARANLEVEIPEQVQAGLLAVESLRLFPSLDGQQALLENTLATEIRRMAHDDDVTSVATSPVGPFAVSGSADGTARVWDAKTGKEIAHMTHDGRVKSVAFSPDGQYVVSGGEDGMIVVWQAMTGKEIERLRHTNKSTVNRVAFSPDGRYVVSAGSDQTARVWEIFDQALEPVNGREIARLEHGDSVLDAAFSRDGRYVVSGSSDKTARVWEIFDEAMNPVNGKAIATLSHEQGVSDVAFSPDGRYVVSGSFDGSARAWEIFDRSNSATGKVISSMPHENGVNAVAFSPDGKSVVSASNDGAVRVWNVANGREIRRMGHERSILAVAFSPDGQFVVTASDDGTARVWEIASGKEVARTTHGETVMSAAFSLDGSYVVSGGNDNTARAWRADNWIEIVHLDQGNYVYKAAISPDGRYVLAASNGGIGRVWELFDAENTATGKELDRVTPDTPLTWALTADERYIAAGSSSGTIRAWTVNGGADGGASNGAGTVRFDELGAAAGTGLPTMSHSGVTTLAISPDGRYVASGGRDRTARLWEVATGREITPTMTYEGAVTKVAFSPDGRFLVSTSEDGTARALEVATRQETASVPHGAPVSTAAFSPDGRYVASAANPTMTRAGSGGARQAATALVWELLDEPDRLTAKVIATLPHGDAIYALAFSPDGKYLVTGGRDKALRIWEVSSSREVASIQQDGPPTTIAFSPDGRYVITGNIDKTARVWQLFNEAGDALRIQEIARMVHDGAVTDASFSHDGRYIITASKGIVRVWHWQPPELVEYTCKLLPRNLTYEEWQRYIGEARPYEKVCDNLELPPAPTAAATPTPTPTARP